MAIWCYPVASTHLGQKRYWQGSKLAHNISESPLPNIGSVIVGELVRQ